jgi:hypothetical protein
MSTMINSITEMQIVRVTSSLKSTSPSGETNWPDMVSEVKDGQCSRKMDNTWNPVVYWIIIRPQEGHITP